MEGEIRIDELDPVEGASPDHEIPAMLSGLTEKLTVAQILALLAPDIAAKFPKTGGTIEGPTDIEGLLRIALKAGMGGKGIIVSGKAAAGPGDEDDAHGLLIALANNLGGSNRQGFLGSSETLIGIRIIGNSIDGYNLGTGARQLLTLGTDTHGSLLLGPVEARHQLTVTGSLVVPRLTTTQRDAMASPAKGMVIYNTDEDDLQVYDGAAWRPVLSVGSGQTYHDVTSSRSAATNYTNNTGRPMFVSIVLGSATGSNVMELVVDNDLVQSVTTTGQRGNIASPIPSGATYRVNLTGSATIRDWWELY